MQLIFALPAPKHSRVLPVRCSCVGRCISSMCWKSCLTQSLHKDTVCPCIPLYCFPMSSKGNLKLTVSLFFSNMTFLKPAYWNRCELHLTHGFSCPPCTARPLVLTYFLPVPRCYYFLLLLQIFLRIFKQQSYFPFPLDVIPWYGMERAKRRAGVVRTVTTQFISPFLLLAMMLQVQEQKQPCVEILQRFLCSATLEARKGSGLPGCTGAGLPAGLPAPGTGDAGEGIHSFQEMGQ